MYEPEPDEGELSAFGFKTSDYDGDVVEIWPDNAQVVALFNDLQTQWFVSGMGGATGLNYASMFHKLDRMKLKPKVYDELESDIRIMELAALAAMKEKEKR